MFVITSLPVGGAETLLVNLLDQLDRQWIAPSVCCLKEPGELGSRAAARVPLWHNLISHKYDVGILWRLASLMRTERTDAVVTVGAGDKMFWGRLAARRARVPVVLSALHSTGWPDGVGRLNRWLTPITDGFIAVAQPHGRFLIEHQRFPDHKVFVIPNGIDTEHFRFDAAARGRWRQRLGIANDAPVCGIVAALRYEKNHEFFLRVARQVADQLPGVRFLIVGDGPERAKLESLSAQLGLDERVVFTGTCHDVPGVLAAVDLFALTSHNEASPVSILEALACERPVVAPRVGSIDQTVIDGQAGYVTQPGDQAAMAARWLELLTNPALRRRMGQTGRRLVCAKGSLAAMARGYERLITEIFERKAGRGRDDRTADCRLPADSPPERPSHQRAWPTSTAASRPPPLAIDLPESSIQAAENMTR